MAGSAVSRFQPGDTVQDRRPGTRHLKRRGRITGLGEDATFGKYAVADFDGSTEKVLLGYLRLVSSVDDARPKASRFTGAEENILENDPRVAAGAKAWDKSMGGRYAPDEVEELSDEVKVILAAADAVDPVRLSEAVPGLLIPGEFTWPKPPADQPDVLISMPYADVWDVFMDGLVNYASMHPVTPEGFGHLAEELLGLLTDASADMADPETGGDFE